MYDGNYDAVVLLDVFFFFATRLWNFFGRFTTFLKFMLFYEPFFFIVVAISEVAGLIDALRRFRCHEDIFSFLSAISVGFKNVKACSDAQFMGNCTDWSFE